MVNSDLPSICLFLEQKCKSIDHNHSIKICDQHWIKGRRVRLLQPPAPKVTIVPCVTICPGETYSASNEQHLNDFGLLAPCDSDSQMIRCIYSLNLDIFMHPENLNLPIFNADKFAGRSICLKKH